MLCCLFIYTRLNKDIDLYFAIENNILVLVLLQHIVIETSHYIKHIKIGNVIVCILSGVPNNTSTPPYIPNNSRLPVQPCKITEN